MRSRIIDVLGKDCPIPLMEAQRALMKAASGQFIRLLTTDQASVLEIQAYCESFAGGKFIGWDQEGDRFIVDIRRVEPQDVATDVTDQEVQRC